MKALCRPPTIAAFSIIIIFVFMAVLSWSGLLVSGTGETNGGVYTPPDLSDLRLWLGTDFMGRSVLYKVIHGAGAAITVGIVAAASGVIIGFTLGAAAGYYGGLVDHAVVWLYTVISSVPSILLLSGASYAFGKGLWAVCAALCIGSWITVARVVRSECMRHKSMDYVIAAESAGAGHLARIFRHILPNLMHHVIVFFTIEFVSAVKAEVVLSFLGVGIQGQPSWGIMIDDAKTELFRGVWWQLAGAGGAVFLLVLSLNLLGDALRDALDPKIK